MRKKKLLLLVVGLLLVLAPAAYAAEYANPSLLIDVETLAKNLEKPDWVALDCRDAKAYAAGHIPGAISLGEECAKAMRDPTLRVKKTADLEKLLGGAGISMKKNVVVYANAQLVTGAAVAFWVLEYMGHDKVAVLNGGVEAWKAGGKPLDTVEKKLPAETFKAGVVKSRIATTEEMVKVAKGEAKGVNVIDSRSEKEHKGSDVRALRGGHIPNTTRHVSHDTTYDVQTGKMFSMDELEKAFGGLDKGRRTIAYCQTGTRSSLIYFQMRLMGFKDPANYDDSWIVYGSNPDCPVENENWYDYVRVNKALKDLDELKKAVEELKKKVP